MDIRRESIQAWCGIWLLVICRLTVCVRFFQAPAGSAGSGKVRDNTVINISNEAASFSNVKDSVGL